jgi:hypothetical protein
VKAAFRAIVKAAKVNTEVKANTTEFRAVVKAGLKDAVKVFQNLP